MFHVTIRTLRKVCWRCGCDCDGDVDEELFPSVDKWAESGPCGKSACRRVNRAVQKCDNVSEVACMHGAKGRAWSR
jgi:hypothetical protein